MSVAILSVHSHGDRSFLDDADLARLSGDLRQAGVPSDLVLVALGRDEDDPAFPALVEVLRGYDVIAFERVWSAALIHALRAALPGKTLVHVRGEHVLEDVPADWIVGGDVRATLPALALFLRGERRRPPPGTEERTETGARRHDEPSLERPREHFDRPNLRPRIVNPEAFAADRSFAIRGNAGCPYQADARDNPVYAGAKLPDGLGRGCAFCTTGNHYEGRSASAAAAYVLDQLRHVRSEAPEITRIVLKDQNPFAYLTEVVETAAKEGLGGFTLMLETRADWLLRSQARFERALDVARGERIRLVPFLVGIENFSQPELDRYNKGIEASTNVAFLEWLWALRERYGETLDLDRASFGFVLFSPWTTLEDLEANHRAIVRTRFDRLRGRLLHSRARLYPDTALYYLAERDGLFADAFAPGHDTSKRYGYFPARPWRHADARVARFSELATALVDEGGGKDEVRIFGALLEAFRAAGDGWASVTADAIRAELTRPPRDLELWRRFAALVAPLPTSGALEGGWSFDRLQRTEHGIAVTLRRPGSDPFELAVVLRGRPAPASELARSRHYTIGTPERLEGAQRAIAVRVADAIVRGDA